jgi:hypothetical protein
VRLGVVEGRRVVALLTGFLRWQPTDWWDSSLYISFVGAIIGVGQMWEGTTY